MKKPMIILALILVLIFIIALPYKQTSAQPHWVPQKGEMRSSKVVIRLHNLQPTYIISILDKAAYQYMIQFVQLVEFIDSNQNGQFEPYERTLSRGILCERTHWDVKVVENDTVLIVNLTAHIRVVSTTPHAGPPNFAYVSIVNRMYRNDVRIGPYHIRGESEVKIDIMVWDWPWKNQNSMIALQIAIDYIQGSNYTEKRKVQMHSSKHENENIHEIVFRSTDADYGIVFRSSKDVTVDNNKVPLSGIAVRENNSICIVYPHFNEFLVHDPSIRIIQLIEEKVGRMGLTIGSIALIISIAITYASIMKIKKKLTSG